MKANSRARSDRQKKPDRQRPKNSADEVAELRAHLTDAQATLRAIRKGEVDAVVVESSLGPKVYTLDGAEFDYRVLIESMNEGALILTGSGLILYANKHFAAMVERPLSQLMGRSLFDVVSVADRAKMGKLLKRPGRIGSATEVLLERTSGASMPVRVSIRTLPKRDAKHPSLGMVVSDLSEFRKREELLRGFSHGLMQAQESERMQMATDLGDNIAQLLCSILVRCQLLASRLPAYETDFRADILGFAKLLRTTADAVHRISTDLRPHGLEILGLVAALRGVAAEFAERMGVSIDVNSVRLTTRLSARAELALYRILQEALRNVERHAQAHHVIVTLGRRGSAVQLTVKDDGIGFDASDQESNGPHDGRIGLLSMRERAITVGGTLNVKSRSSGGTEVRLTIPSSS